jgi:hypothetical protein
VTAAPAPAEKSGAPAAQSQEEIQKTLAGHEKNLGRLRDEIGKLVPGSGSYELMKQDIEASEKAIKEWKAKLSTPP